SEASTARRGCDAGVSASLGLGRVNTQAPAARVSARQQPPSHTNRLGYKDVASMGTPPGANGVGSVTGRGGAFRDPEGGSDGPQVFRAVADDDRLTGPAPGEHGEGLRMD